MCGTCMACARAHVYTHAYTHAHAPESDAASSASSVLLPDPGAPVRCKTDGPPSAAALGTESTQVRRLASAEADEPWTGAGAACMGHNYMGNNYIGHNFIVRMDRCRRRHLSILTIKLWPM